MKHDRESLYTLLAVAILVTGCASRPPANAVAVTSAATNCLQLSAEIANAEAEKQDALKKEQSAWKAIVPFAVMARYASGRSTAESADKQLVKLRADFAAQGCGDHGL